MSGLSWTEVKTNPPYKDLKQLFKPPYQTWFTTKMKSKQVIRSIHCK